MKTYRFRVEYLIELEDDEIPTTELLEEKMLYDGSTMDYTEIVDWLDD